MIDLSHMTQYYKTHTPGHNHKLVTQVKGQTDRTYMWHPTLLAHPHDGPVLEL